MRPTAFRDVPVSPPLSTLAFARALARARFFLVNPGADSDSQRGEEETA